LYEKLFSVPVPVSLLADPIDEFDERFVANLMAPINATIADGQGVATILDDDVVELVIADVQATEAAGANMVFGVPG
jgi:hypothetical protein